MSERGEIIQAMRARVGDTPYAVDETAEGFVLTLDLADARWWTLYQRNGLRRVHTHRVTLMEDTRKFEIRDEIRMLTWEAGAAAGQTVPRLSAEAEVVRGRSISVGVHKEWGVTDQGRVAKVVDYSFTTTEAHGIIREVLAPRGYSERLPGEACYALYFGVAVLALLALSGIVLLVLWLVGAFP